MDMKRITITVTLVVASLTLAACTSPLKSTAPPSPWAPSTTRNFVSDGVGVYGCDTWEMAKRVNHDDIYPIESWMLGFCLD